MFKKRAACCLELDAFTPRLEAQLAKFNQMQTGKRNEYRRKVHEPGIEAAKNGGGGAGAAEEAAIGERASKRVRREVGGRGGLEVVGGEEAGTGDETADEDEGDVEAEAETEGEVGDEVEEEEEEEGSEEE